LPQASGGELPYWAKFVLEFKHEQGCDNWAKGPSFVFDTVLFHPRETLQWLKERFESNGGIIVQEKVTSLSDLFEQYSCRVVINCTGLNSLFLVKDTKVAPIRGQLALVKPPISYPQDTIIIIEEPDNLVYTVPRKEGLVVGGTVQEGDWKTEVNEEDHTEMIRKASVLLFKDIEKAEVLKKWVGLRPSREEGLRLERDNEFSSDNKLLIHNYGHGGSGWSVCWGCAFKVLELVNSFNT